MKGFPRRLLFYAIGLGFGLLISVYLVKGKMGGELPEFCYLPNCRVLKALRSKPLVIRPGQAQECHLNDRLLDQILTDGDVLFSQSDPRKEPCGEYLITYQDYRVRVQKCPDTTFILAMPVACSTSPNDQ